MTFDDLATERVDGIEMCALADHCCGFYPDSSTEVCAQRRLDRSCREASRRAFEVLDAAADLNRALSQGEKAITSAKDGLYKALDRAELRRE